MRLLTATRSGRGTRDGDFCFAVEGELVLVNDDVCASDRGDPDGGCGCGRAFVGLNSRRGTTTAVIRDLDLPPEDVRAALEGVDVLARALPDQGVFGRRLDTLYARPGAGPGG